MVKFFDSVKSAVSTATEKIKAAGGDKLPAIPAAAKEKPKMLGDGDEAQAKTFKYSDHIVTPSEDLNNINANPFSLVTTLRDNLDYAVSSLMKGRDCKTKNLTLGNRFFVASGTCDREKSVPACRGKTRYFYVDNVPTSVMPCLDTTRPYDPNCDQGGTGLMNGMISDILHLNPFELLASASGNGSIINSKCVRRTEKVGYESGDDQQYHYETRCAPMRQPLICSLKSKSTKCRVYTKHYDAERNVDGNVSEILGGDICTLYQHNAAAENLLEEMRNLSFTREVELKLQGEAFPGKKLNWMVIGTSRDGEPVYAQYDDTKSCYVSDVGFSLLGTRQTLSVFKSAFSDIMQCKHTKESTSHCNSQGAGKKLCLSKIGASECTEAELVQKYNKVRQLVLPVILKSDTILHNDHSNSVLQQFLETFISKYNPLEEEPKEIEKRTLDKFNIGWRTTVKNVHSEMSTNWDALHAGSDPFKLKNACLTRFADCENDWVLYVWIVTVYRDQRTYGFQIQWRAYYNPFEETIAITRVGIVGNPTAIDIPADDIDAQAAVQINQQAPDEKWANVENFRNRRDADSPGADRPVSRNATAALVGLALLIVSAVIVAAVLPRILKSSPPSQRAGATTIAAAAAAYALFLAYIFGVV